MKQTKEKRKRRTKLNIRRASALLFIVLLFGISVINLLTKDRSFSERENRVLEQSPDVTLAGIESGRFMDQYESYKADQFAGRDIWVSLKTNVDYLFGKRESNGIFKGKRKYLLEDITVPKEEELSRNLEAIKSFQKEYPDVPAYMMLVPNAANVMSDKLPMLAVTEDQTAQFADIRKTLGDAVNWIDVEKTLKKHRDEKLYYHTDHHWTTLGAYYAYQTLTDEMGLDKSQAPKWKPYAVTKTFNGTLSASSGYETGYGEPIYIYSAKNTKDNPQVVVNYVDEQEKKATLYDTSKLTGKDKYALFLGGNSAMIDIRTNADSTDRLLLLKDSYANCLIPFLTAHYREIIVIDPRYYYGDIHKVMEENKITSILYVYNGNTFVEDNSINGVLEAN